MQLSYDNKKNVIMFNDIRIRNSLESHPQFPIVHNLSIKIKDFEEAKRVYGISLQQNKCTNSNNVFQTCLPDFNLV